MRFLKSFCTLLIFIILGSWDDMDQLMTFLIL